MRTAIAGVCVMLAEGTTAAYGQAPSVTVDRVTRYIHVRYAVPAGAPDEVAVTCTWSAPGADDWRPAKVMPLIGETALRLLPGEEWRRWVVEGRITERRGAGLERTVVFNPYPEAQQDGRVDVDFRISVASPDGELLAEYQLRLEADNSDVVYIEDWTGVYQHSALAGPDDGEGAAKWACQTDLDPGEATLGNALYGYADSATGLPQLSYPLDLKGSYAVFVCTTPGKGSIRMRLSGDERKDRLSSRFLFEEVFWRWTRMDRQNLVLRQPYQYTGYSAGQIDYVKLVPLTQELVDKLDGQFGEECDKIVAGYWEPYSYAFSDDVEEASWHREYLTAYPEARVPIVDMQIGRFGAKVVYESRETDPLVYATRGDPIGTVAHPETDNVGRMQQFTNTLEASLRCARDLGFQLHANFGASNCYPGSPLQGDFSKAHPEWMRGSALRFEVPEVRAYVLSLYREALEIGAEALSIDFCRYPETVDSVETGNTFMRELRTLADEFREVRGKRVPILVRFPGTGVRRCEFFDYATWAREEWVDYLCPSNIQGRHHHIDPAPYLQAARGTSCKVLPCVDALSWGLPMPGPYLWHVARLYDAGVQGVYVYQADSRLLGRPCDRRCMRLLANSAAVRAWWEEEERLRPTRSKGIYITPHHQIGGYHGWERLRIWVEGVPMGEMEVYLDGERVNRFEGPPYLVGTEEYDSDGVIPPGDHELRIRVKDGDGWLEQTFAIAGAG